MKGFEPDHRDKQIIFDALPCTKEQLIKILKAKLYNLTDKQARSLIWNMHYRGYIYTFEGLIKKV
jgi:hypothetical protein